MKMTMRLTEKITAGVMDAIMPELEKYIKNADLEIKEGQRKFLEHVGEVLVQFEKNFTAQIMNEVNERLKLEYSKR